MSGANKHDTGKPPLELVPREMIEGAARAFAFGANKYGRGNWMKGGLTQGRLLGAVLRHLYAYAQRDDLDPESGLCHLDHAAASLGMLMGTVARDLGADDRIPEPQPGFTGVDRTQDRGGGVSVEALARMLRPGDEGAVPVAVNDRPGF